MATDASATVRLNVRPPKQPTLGKVTPAYSHILQARLSGRKVLVSDFYGLSQPIFSNTQGYDAIINAMMSRNTSQKSLMEAITLLYMLDECPETAKENQQSNSFSVLSSIYQLPFQREKQIVEDLAFLSATTHDPTKVMAVCLEEARDRRSCTIRLTSNNGDIDKVMHGFKLMAKILEQSASRANSKDDDTKALFRCIVTLNYCRILSQLQSRHAKKTSRGKGKSVLIPLLDTATRDKSVRPGPDIKVMELTDILTKINTLKALFMKFEDIQKHSAASSMVQDVAMEMITQMHDLAYQTKLKLALSSSKALEPELKTSLSEAVEELGRYYSISYELVCVARSEEYSIFNSITIETSPTPRPSQPLNVDKNIHPVTALQNILRPRTAESRPLKPLLEKCLGKPIRSILNEFRRAIATYHESVKVHAEIQLLFFYELNSERIRPRTICSSKSACYLCDLFFRLHGQYYVPRTHGRLYHRWTLPDWHILLPEKRRREFDVLLGKFSDILKVKVKAALDREPVRAKHPNKSTLASPLSHITQPPPQAELLTDATSPSILPSTSTLCPPTQEPMTPREVPSRDTSTNTPTVSLPPLNPSSTTPPNLHHKLTKGEPFRRPVSYPNISINIGTTGLNLHLSSDTTMSFNPDVLSNPSSRCLVRVKWLQGAESGNVNLQAINAEDLNYDTEMEVYHGATSTPTELHLRRGENFVSIKYAFDEPK
ncbi:MAG: hypothetical protein Q9167_005787 [Letrouitia subvulpina]